MCFSHNIKLTVLLRTPAAAVPVRIPAPTGHDPNCLFMHLVVDSQILVPEHVLPKKLGTMLLPGFEFRWV